MPAAKRTKVFTDNAVAALKCARNKPFTDIAEGGGRDTGFGVRVYSTGKKVFFYKFPFDGKLKYMSLGEFPEVSLEAAQKKYTEARKSLKNGQDPRVKKVEPESTAENSTEKKGKVTMKQVVENFLNKFRRREGHSPQSAKSHEYTFNADVLPIWGDRAASSIHKAEIIDLLESIVKRGAPGQALNVLKTCRTAWEYAISAQLIKRRNPFKDINLKHVLLEQSAVKRQPVLSLAAAISACAVLMGRKVQTETGLRTNLYIIGTGETSCGKDHARQKLKELFVLAGCDDLLGPEEIASASALRRFTCSAG